MVNYLIGGRAFGIVIGSRLSDTSAVNNYLGQVIANEIPVSVS